LRKLDLDLGFYGKNYFHARPREETIPKDRPSVDVSLALAPLLALTKRKGGREEPTLGKSAPRGRALPSAASKRRSWPPTAGNSRPSLSPRITRKTPKDIPERILKTFNVIPVKMADNVSRSALASDEDSPLFHEPEETVKGLKEEYELPDSPLLSPAPSAPNLEGPRLDA
jgi:ATP-dependent Lon protease